MRGEDRRENRNAFSFTILRNYSAMGKLTNCPAQKDTS